MQHTTLRPLRRWQRLGTVPRSRIHQTLDKPRPAIASRATRKAQSISQLRGLRLTSFCGGKFATTNAQHRTATHNLPLYRRGLVEKFITSNRSTLFFQTGWHRPRTTVSNRLDLSRERERRTERAETPADSERRTCLFSSPKNSDGKGFQKFQKGA